MNKLGKAFNNEEGFVDLQSVMVGVIISAIVAGTAVVGLIGLTNMISDDNTRTTLKTFSIGMESFYTDKDRYPTSLAELADGKYVPQSYKTFANTDLCYVPGAGTLPQTYTATSRSASTGNFFANSDVASDAVAVTSYPAINTCQ